MELTELQALLLLHGEDKVIGFIFDNSGRVMFNSTKPFDAATNIIDSIGAGMLMFEGVDISGIPYIVYKPVGTIQSVMFVKTVGDIDKVDHRYLGQ